MSTLASIFKSEVTRLARREVKSATEPLRTAVVQYRHDIARLKRQVDEQRREIEFLKGEEKKRLASGTAAEPEVVLNGDVRFSARSVAAQRKRLGLSVRDFGRLIGVSGQTIYNWEQGATRPGDEQFAAFVAVRGFGKREARRRLEVLGE